MEDNAGWMATKASNDVMIMGRQIKALEQEIADLKECQSNFRFALYVIEVWLRGTGQATFAEWVTRASRGHYKEDDPPSAFVESLTEISSTLV